MDSSRAAPEMNRADDKAVSANRARQGVTGHNVRYVLVLGLAGVAVGFFVLYMFFFAGG
jgi:hypothetical protein